MAENKTKQTAASVEDYFAAIADPARRADCAALAKLITKVTKEPAKMWGPSIVGFGSYHYVYDSGREGDSSVVGFSSRASSITVYLKGIYEGEDSWPPELGKFKTGKGCLYIASLADIDTKVLEKLVARSVAYVKKQYG